MSYRNRISLSDRLGNAISELEDGRGKFNDIVRNAIYIQDECSKADDSWPPEIGNMLAEIGQAAKDIEAAIGSTY